MRFWNTLRATEFSHNTQLQLDIALLLAVVPHLFVMKLPVLLYLLAVVGALKMTKEGSKKLVALFAFLGFGAIATAFMGAFNFVGLSNMNTYVQLIASLLLLAVSLQRLSRSINFYILFSPGMLLALSYFFYNSILMLFYAIFALFIFLTLLLLNRMRAPLGEAVRMSGMLFALSLPAVVFLFLVFPRISFETRDFGFRDTQSLRTGHDGLMHIGSDALLVPSKKVAMEVWFEGEMPSDEQLYFRGSVLYYDMGTLWKPLPSFKRDVNVTLGGGEGKIGYFVTLYPHKKQWLYTLDYTVEVPSKSVVDADMIVRNAKPVDDVYRYHATSLLQPQTPQNPGTIAMDAALKVNEGRDPRSEAAVKAFIGDDAERLKRLIAWFSARKLAYSLQPGSLDMAHPVDSFLFGSKTGYCVHFAAAFTTLARMAGLPARVVTGFKGDSTNRYKNYLMLLEEDAHAWAEVFVKAKGWVRIDPTHYAAAMVDAQRLETDLKAQSAWQRFYDQANLYVMYGKYVIQKWILYYDRSRQMQLLRDLMADTFLVLQFVGAFAILIAVVILAVVALRRRSCDDPVLCALQPLLKKLERAGYVKAPSEDMHHFLIRASSVAPDAIAEIDALYHRLRYGTAAKVEEISVLKSLCRRVEQPKA